jgi:hypothetical protein
MFDPIKHREQFLVDLRVRSLRCRETGAIDAVVDRRIDLLSTHRCGTPAWAVEDLLDRAATGPHRDEMLDLGIQVCLSDVPSGKKKPPSPTSVAPLH